MTAGMKRIVLRWLHLLFGLPLIGFVYGPPAETEQYRFMFQYVFMPMILVTGLWMWKGPAIERLIFRKSA